MKTIEKVKGTVTSVYRHFKKNSATYTILGIIGYLLYKILKIVTDTGMKDGEPYYKEFEDPEDKEIENKEEQ